MLHKRKTILIVLVLSVCMLLCACGNAARISLPPLPTPTVETPAPSPAETAVRTPDAAQAPASEPSPEPEATTAPTPEPTPEPTPTPEPEDPNTPHLSIANETLPQDMRQYGIMTLLGEISTDKGMIVQVRGVITDEEGNVIEGQECLDFPYAPFCSIAGTVNAALQFALLHPGHYIYELSAIADNNGVTNEEVLISQPFEVYYP